MPTAAQIKHTYVLGSRWVNQASLGFSRLSVPIFNATIDGRYPIEAGLRGLPAGEADSAFPEVAFAGPNAPTQWRGTDARAFTEYLNNYTFQNNLNWTTGKHAMTFGFQSQRMDANERERTYGSLATFGFSNAQTAGFSPTGTLMTATGNAYASFLLGDLNATNVVEDSEVATSGRFYTYAFWAQDDFKLRPNLTLNLGLRYDIMKPYTEVYDRWSFMNPDLPNAAVGGYRGAVQFAGNGTNSCNCRTPIETYYGAIGPRLGVAYSLNDATVLRALVRHQLFAARRRRWARRRAQRDGHARDSPPTPRFRAPNTFDPSYNWNNGVPSYPAPPFFDPTLNAGFVVGRGTWRRRDLRGSGYRRAAAALSELERRVPARADEDDHGRRDHTPVVAAISSAAPAAGSISNQLDPQYLVLGNLLTQQATPANRGRGAGHRAWHRSAVPQLLGDHLADVAALPAVLRRHRRLRKRGVVELQLPPAHGRETPNGRWVDGELQLHLQQDRRQSRRAHGIQLRSGLGSRRQRSAARLECHGRLHHAVRRAGQAGQRQLRR